MAAQNRLHVLVQDKARPNQPAEAEHEREQPNNARDRRLIRELQLELGEVDLRLIGLETNLKARQLSRTDLAQHVSDGGIGALIAAFAKLPQQSAAGQARIGPHALAEIWDKWIDQSFARLAGAIDRRLQTTGDAFAKARPLLSLWPFLNVT